MSKSEIKRLSIAIGVILAAVGFIILGVYLWNNEEYYGVSLGIILLSLLPMVFLYEHRKPKTGELALIAVMCALGIVGRMAFFMLPQVKPMVAMTVIMGISLGWEAGFLGGAVMAFVSNFYFAQGPWTPFQMFAMAVIGLLAGLIFRGKAKNAWVVSLVGGFMAFAVYGAIVDLSTLLMISDRPTWSLCLVTFASGLQANIVHGIATFIFLRLLYRPVISKVTRIKDKFGLLS